MLSVGLKPETRERTEICETVLSILEGFLLVIQIEKTEK
jgi:hypothetical protein